jgi:hypothetical protein
MHRPLGWAAALLAGTAAAVLSTTTSVQAAACPALDYQAGLATAAAALREAPPDVAGAERRLDALLAADAGSAVALEPVLRDLSAAPPDVDDARSRLSSMSATLAYPRGSVCDENAGAARSALHSVYASPDFGHLDDSTRQGLLQTILDAIAKLLSGGAAALGPVGAVVLASALVAICLLLAWRRWHGSAGLGAAAVDEPPSAGDDPDVEWRAAQRAAAGGDHREAVRRAFRSALLEVAVRGGVHIDAAWTTRELLHRIDAGGDVLLALAAAGALFESAWYSGRAVTRDDWERAEERCSTVRRLARSRGAVPR